MFKNSITEQKTALIHFDANNAYVDVRSNILNFLQNRGIERGEITTSDSHTVARQFSNRGYSPIGDKIKTDYILSKLETMIEEAEDDALEEEITEDEPEREEEKEIIESFICPICTKSVSETAIQCTHCGVEFENEDDEEE